MGVNYGHGAKDGMVASPRCTLEAWVWSWVLDTPREDQCRFVQMHWGKAGISPLNEYTAYRLHKGTEHHSHGSQGSYHVLVLKFGISNDTIFLN